MCDIKNIGIINYTSEEHPKISIKIGSIEISWKYVGAENVVGSKLRQFFVIVVGVIVLNISQFLIKTYTALDGITSLLISLGIALFIAFTMKSYFEMKRIKEERKDIMESY